jgi:hypothetical protein
MIATLARDKKNKNKKNILKGEGTLYVLVHVGPIPTTKEGMLHFENEVHTLISKIKHACTLQGL